MNCDNCSSCNLDKWHEDFQKIKYQFQNQDFSNFEYNYNVHSHPKAMLLSLTDSCNLSCSYCFVKQHPNHMTYETAEKAIEWLFENNKNEQKQIFDVTFFGGEPLLHYNDIIVPIVNKYKDKINFSITTNGTLLDEDKVDFFYHNNVSILLSFDGIEKIQNIQRPGKNFNSFEAVRDNIPYLLLRFPDTTMRITLTKTALPYLFDTVVLAEEFGFTNITFCPDAYEDWTWDDAVIYEEQLTKIGLHIYNSFFNNNPIAIKVNPLIHTFNNIQRSLRNELKYNNTIMRCGLGTTSCAITPSGDIVPCQEKTSNPTNIIGNVYQGGIDPKKHEQFLVWYIQKMNNDFVCDKKCLNLKECVHCLSSICPSRLEDLNFKPSSSECIFNRVTLRVANRLYSLCHHHIDARICKYFS